MEITKEILDELTVLKNSQCKKERIHAHALLLLNKGKSIQEVAEVFDVTERSIYSWLKKFNNEGIASLSRKAGAGRKTILNESDKDIVDLILHPISLMLGVRLVQHFLYQQR